ncbi:MAG: Hsp20/alpha crystallin family protein [Anaerolineae bacterium]|nr:Hsp20/alpha crystallin family protein [Anaerolineae bacterium]
MTTEDRYARWVQGVPAMKRLGAGWAVFQNGYTWEPPVDVYENDDGLVVQVEVGGMRVEDFSITLDQRILVVEGLRQRDAEPKRVYRQMEIFYGPFRVEVDLPWSVDAERVEATYEMGILRVLLPRPPAHRVSVSNVMESK